VIDADYRDREGHDDDHDYDMPESARPRRIHPGTSLMLVIMAAALIFGIAGPTGPLPATPSRVSAGQAGIKAEPAILTFQRVSAAVAAKLNEATPEFKGPIEAAMPFTISRLTPDPGAQMNALECLASAVYYEAASESDTGQRAVAQVVLNRTRHPAYPNSVCGVVFQGSERKTGCQFSFTCDGSMARVPSTKAWVRASIVAQQALAGYVEPLVGFSTHYHTIWVLPYWQSSLTKIATIGSHIFYRWAGGAGMGTAFAQRYSGIEAQPERAAFAASMRAKLAELEATAATETSVNAVAAAEPPVEEPPAPSEPPRFALPEPQGSTGATLSADASRTTLLADENRGDLIQK
jgi:spore germination cell wall hydrolase CwlJ-like protein